MDSLPDASDLRAAGLPERYEPLRRLGGGAQAETLLVQDTEAERMLVAKVFRLATADGWKPFELFERECAVLRTLNHPSIPRYVEHGGDEAKGVFYLLMEHADGADLQTHIQEQRRCSSDELWQMLDQMLDVLEYLHDLLPPVVHRDIKPGNIVVGAEGKLWLVDFGVVREALGDPNASTIVGTFGTMAPEQLRGTATPASDIFGLGATFAAVAAGVDAGRLPTKGLEIDLEAFLDDGPFRQVLQAMVRADPGYRLASATAVRDFVAQARRGALVPQPALPVFAVPQEAALAKPLAMASLSTSDQLSIAAFSVGTGILTAMLVAPLAGVAITVIGFLAVPKFMRGFRRAVPETKP